MPGVASLEALQRAVDDFDITSFRLDIDPAAHAATRDSLERSGLLLLGEVHGVRQNPLVARALMVELGVTGLALEWPAGLAAALSGFFADGRIPDHPLLWGGDGRITVGHFALLRERFIEGHLAALTLFDGVSEVGWSRREAAMADRILSAQGPGVSTLVVAGSAHTTLAPTGLGVPLGARLAEQRPGVREIRVRYGNGSYYNLIPQRFKRHWSLRRHARLHVEGGTLVLDLPGPMQARVPHRMQSNQPRQPRPPGYTSAFPAAGQTGPFPRPDPFDEVGPPGHIGRPVPQGPPVPLPPVPPRQPGRQELPGPGWPRQDRPVPPGQPPRRQYPYQAAPPAR